LWWQLYELLRETLPYNELLALLGRIHAPLRDFLNPPPPPTMALDARLSRMTQEEMFKELRASFSPDYSKPAGLIGDLERALAALRAAPMLQRGRRAHLPTTKEARVGALFLEYLSRGDLSPTTTHRDAVYRVQLDRRFIELEPSSSVTGRAWRAVRKSSNTSSGS
jgi:hypothetical protein